MVYIVNKVVLGVAFMISKILSCGLSGLDGYMVTVETDISPGIPSFDIVGLGGTAVKESKERVRSAIRNSGFEYPVRRITINLAPASIRKEGSAYDLPIALGVLVAAGQVAIDEIQNYAFVGELSLNGDIKPIKGALSMALFLNNSHVKNLVLPVENAPEAAVVQGVNVYAASHISEVIGHLNGLNAIEPVTIDMDTIFNISRTYDVDFKDVKGQLNVKRALEVAAAGGHNCFMVGSPGSGKTMLAKRLPTILPGLSFEESLQVTKIHSISGLMPPNTPLITARPFRAPHHTISNSSLAGGGSMPRPGELSLAHLGVLFLDELPEFDTNALEVLRQPLEEGYVNISRVNACLSYPCAAMLICAANPCKCGYLGDSSRQCTCTPYSVQQYLGRLSGPLLDRIDIQVEVASVGFKELESGSDDESSPVIRERVVKARKKQLERYKGSSIFTNSQLTHSQLHKYCTLDIKERELLANAFERLGLSARAHNKILKVARTIADLDESEKIAVKHLAEAVQYRSLDRKYAV